ATSRTGDALHSSPRHTVIAVGCARFDCSLTRLARARATAIQPHDTWPASIDCEFAIHRRSGPVHHGHLSMSPTEAAPMMRRIPCVLTRGGSSKGLYFRAADLPGDPSARDRVLLAAMGSPDRRQIDGLGGG